MPARTLLHRIKLFASSPTVPGLLLLGCVVISLIIANSPVGPAFEALLSKELGYHTDSIQLRYPILLWVNDGLMAIFFLLVGLEIKRELVNGDLSTPRKAALPFFAAIGGVLVPALIYTLFNHGRVTAHGWAIPMATDIAFALGVIMLLGKRVPLSLKIFLAALAIVDDLMAILVIAIFYAEELQYVYLAYAGIIFLLVLLLNRLGIRNLALYLIPGLFIWYFIHHSGIHATIAGVLTALAIPANAGQGEASPLHRLEHILVKPVNFLIMPVFALANTNITFVDGMLAGLMTPLGLGIVLGLVVGKPVGIVLLSWLTVKLGLCNMPQGAGWKHMVGVGMLAGIGFTMSIFLAVLSFTGYGLLLEEAKFSILTASLISGICGSLLLTRIHKRHNMQERTEADE